MMWKKERDTGGVQGSDWIQDLWPTRNTAHTDQTDFYKHSTKKHLLTTPNASFAGQTANIKPISFRLEIVW